MLATLTLVLAQGTGNTQEAPDEGVGAALIIGAVLLAILLFGLVFAVFAKRSKASKGGVEPVPGNRTRGEPPFESVDRDQSPS